MAFTVVNSDLDVINLALQRLGHDTIVDIDENTEAAILARATYDTARKAMLEMQAWNFATKYATCVSATLPAAAAMTYDRAYTLPTNWLRILEVEGQTADVGDEWEISDGLLLTNLGDTTARVRYVEDSTVVSAWSSSFIDALAARLERDWAERLTKETSLGERKAAEYETVLARARTYDSQQATPKRIEASSWISSR